MTPIEKLRDILEKGEAQARRNGNVLDGMYISAELARDIISAWPEPCEDVISRQPTLYGYNIEHLELIARVLQKEDLPPERVAEVLINIGEIVAIVRDEFEETLRRAVEQCTT